MLSHKIQSLNKEINELKHRLNKLIKVDKKMTSSKKKNRLGSHMSRGVKNAFETKKLFGNRKLSHACKSPKMKKVLSNRALIESRVGNAFGRRETLDINKSGSLLNLGLHEDKNHRISEITNIMTSDEDISSNYVPKDDRSVTQNSSRNKLGRCGSTQNQL